jgi:hypothetical protein
MIDGGITVAEAARTLKIGRFTAYAALRHQPSSGIRRQLLA